MTKVAFPGQRDTLAGLTAGSARSLLFTVLGVMTWPVGGSVRTATLVQILDGLGIEEQTARQAIARAAASDWIVPERRGREVSWSLSARLVAIFRDGVARVSSVSDPYAEWDGRWLAVLVTIPHELRASRRPLYAGLTWAGFGDPAPGVWVTPHTERAPEVAALVAQLGLREHAIAVAGTVESIGMSPEEVVARGWDLEEPRQRYHAVEEMLDHLDPRSPEQVLLAHVRAMNAWQEFPRFDPQLPEALLPNWIGRRVSQRMEELSSRWTAIVHARYRDLEGADPPRKLRPGH
ncbi:MAG: PaaX family transcriptional regulator C-terminal domain-containing protein [Tetrasphaera sp.]